MTWSAEQVVVKTPMYMNVLKNDVQVVGKSCRRGERLVVLHLNVAVILALLGLAGKDVLAVTVELEAGDDNIGRVNLEGDCGAVGLLTVHTLDVDDPLLAVDLEHLTLGTLRRSTDNQNFVILTDRNGSNLSNTNKAKVSIGILERAELQAATVRAEADTTSLLS